MTEETLGSTQPSRHGCIEVATDDLAYVFSDQCMPSFLITGSNCLELPRIPVEFQLDPPDSNDAEI